MAKFDFRILLETIEGKKTSYISQSFVDTDVDLVLSASQVYNRITGSVSCSYQNAQIFSGSDFNTNFKFGDNNLLSASLQGGGNTGSIDFDGTLDTYDRLLRYKFFGEKVCNVLGLPSNQWVYVDQVRFPSDNEANIFQGNVNAGNMFVSDTLTFASNANVNSDIPFYIDTGSDRYIKFIDTRETGKVSLIFGYDKDTDTYEINASTGSVFNIKNLNNLDVDTINAAVVNQVTSSTATTLATSFNQLVVTGSLIVSGSEDEEPLLRIEGNISSSGTGSFGMIHQKDDKKIVLGTGRDLQIYHSGANSFIQDQGTGDLKILGTNLKLQDKDGGDYLTATDNAGVKIFFNDSEKLETTNTGINVSGQITASGNISSSHTGSFGKLTIGAPSSMLASQTQLTVAGGEGGVDIASFYRNISGTGRVNISFSDSDPTIEFFEDINDKTNSIGSDATNSNFVFATGSKLKDKEAMVIQNDGGNVGIGINSPGQKLTVEGNISASGELFATDLTLNGSGINIVNDSGFEILGTGTQIMNIGSQGDLVLLAGSGGSDSSHDLHFGSAGVNSQMVLKDGKLGIGTTSPSEELHVVSGTIFADGPGAEIKIARGGYDTYVFRQSSGTGLELKNITDDRVEVKVQNGKVGIGNDVTNPGGTLHISSSNDPNLIIEDPNGSALVRFKRTDTGKLFDLSMQGSDLRFTPTDTDGSMNVLVGVNASSEKIDSRLGVGKATPREMLDVSGSIIVEGDISASGAINTLSHITASGNISASGTIFASAFSSPDGDGDIDLSNSLDISGNITASGNISSSGTGTNVFGGGATFGSDVTVSGNVTATTFTTQEITINTSDGSTVFGNTPNDDTHQFTGSVSISGSNPLTVIGETKSDEIIAQQKLAVGTPTHAPNMELTVEGDISGSGTGSFGEINLEDNKRIKLGNAGDLQIYHNGDNSVISDVGAGDLLINGANVRIRDANDGDTIALFTQGAGVELRHDNTIRFETSDGGINVTGHITASGNISASGTIFASAFSSPDGDGDIDFVDSLDVAGNITASGDISASGILNAKQLVFGESDTTNPQTIKFNDINTLSSSKTTGLMWDFPNDDVFIYAHQSSSDGTRTVFESSDNTTNDAFTFWFNDYRGPHYDAFPLHMRGDRFVVNNPQDRNSVYHKDQNHPSSSWNSGPAAANNVDFYLLKSGSTSVSTANSLIHGDVSAGKTTLNDIVFVDGNITASGNISASGDMFAKNLELTADSSAEATLFILGAGSNPADAGKIKFTENADKTGGSYTLEHNGSTNKLILNSNTNNNLIVFDRTNARVGINTNTPTKALQVTGDISASGVVHLEDTIDMTNNKAIRWNNGGNFSSIRAEGNHLKYIAYGSGDHIFRSNTSDDLVIFDNTGNVGIGTTSPSNALHISTGSGNNLTPALRLNKLVDDDGSDGGTATGILMGAVNAGSAKTGIFSENAGAGNGRQNLIFAMDSTSDTSDADLSDERMRITHDGKVGIGTTNPTHTLTVAGDISASDGTRALQYDVSAHALKSSGATLDFNGTDFSFNTNDLYVDQSNSNIGIGTTTPPSTLTVEGNISQSLSSTSSFGRATIGTTTPKNHSTAFTVNGGAGGTHIAHFERTIGGTGQVSINANSSDPQVRFFEGSDYVAIGQDSTNSNLVFATGSIIKDKEAMVINTSGKVGIGTTSPTTPLHVENDGSVSNLLAYFKSGDHSAKLRLEDDDTMAYFNVLDDTIRLNFTSDASDPGLVIKSGSLGVQVGIGTISPKTALHIHTGSSAVNILKFTNADTGTNIGDGFDIGLNSDESATIMQKENSSLHLGTNNLDRITILNNGNVGIGGGSPDYLLDVEGDVGIDKFIYHNGDDDTFFRFADGDDKITLSAGGSHLNFTPTGLGIGVTAVGSNKLQVAGNISASGTLFVDEIHSPTQTTNKLILEDDQDGAVNQVSLQSVNFINLMVDGNGNGTGGLNIMSGSYDADTAKTMVRVETGTGNVGIGTTSPTRKLQVIETTANPVANFKSLGDAPIVVESTNGTTGIKFKDNSAQQELYFRGNRNAFYIENPTKLGLGTNDPSEILDVVGNIKARDKITSTTFESGFAGSGFRIETGSAGTLFTVDDLTVRGTMSVFELLIHQIRATNGSLFVSNTGKITSASLSTVDNHYSMSFDTGSGYGHSFLVGDLVRAQRFVPSTNGSGSQVFKSDLHIIAVNGTGSAVGVLTASAGEQHPLSQSAPQPGYEYVRIGSTTEEDRQGSIYLTADDDNAPFIDVVDGLTAHSQFNTSGKTKVRMGKLSGIGTTTFGTLPGYGFYASGSAFLEGSINATSGSIGDFIIDNTEIRDTGNNLRLKSTGRITASRALIKGNSEIAGFNISDSQISSQTGTLILKDSGQITGSAVSMSGVITATKLVASQEGEIGGFTINADELSSGNFKLNSTDNTLRLGTVEDFNKDGTNVGLFVDGDDGQFFVGKEDGDFIHFDGTDVSIKSTNLIITASTIDMTTTQFEFDANNGDLQLSSTQKSMSLANQKIILKGDTAMISLNDSTFGNDGIQMSGSGEFHVGNSTSNIRFENSSLGIVSQNIVASGSSVEIVTPNIFLGEGSTNFISASGDVLEISSSNFHLKNGNITASNVDLSGKITAQEGTIGGFIIESETLKDTNSTPRLILSSSGKINLGAGITLDATGDLNSGTIQVGNKVQLNGSSDSTIGGFIIGQNTFTSNNFILNTDVDTLQLGTVTDFAKDGSDKGLFVSGTGDFFIGKEDKDFIHFDASSGNLEISSSNIKVEVDDLHITASDIDMTTTEFNLNANGGDLLLDSVNKQISLAHGNIVLDGDSNSDVGHILVGTLTGPGDTTSERTGLYAVGDGRILLKASSSNYIKLNNDNVEIKSTNVDISGSSVEIQSPNVFLGEGNSNFISASAGRLEISSSNFHLIQGNITASNVDLSGKITATTGNIGGFDIGSDLSATNFTLNPSGKRITLGTSNTIFIADGDEGIFLGNSSKNSAPFSVDLAGAITASSGTIGGFTIDETDIRTPYDSDGGFGLEKDTKKLTFRTGSESNTIVLTVGRLDANKFGIEAKDVNDSSKTLFKLGNGNEIAGFEFTQNEIAKNNITMSSAGDGRITLNQGTIILSGSGEGQFADGSIKFDKFGNLDITDARLRISSNGFQPDAFNAATGKFVDMMFSGSVNEISDLNPDGNVQIVAFEDNTIVTRISQSGEIRDTLVLSASQVSTNMSDRKPGDIYDANKPIFAYNTEGAPLAPLSAVGKNFLTKCDRDLPFRLQFFSPFGDAKVHIASGSNNSGVFDKTLADITVSQSLLTAQDGKIEIDDFDEFYQITSSLPIVVSAISLNITHSAGTTNVINSGDTDRIFIPPVSKEVFIPSDVGPETLEGSPNQTISNKKSTYFFSDSPFALYNSGDGDGSDAEHGLPIEMLGDTYVVPHTLSDYRITAVESGVIEVFRIHAGEKILFDTHLISGSKANPQEIEVGPIDGDDSELFTGQAVRFEGTMPFFLRVNDPHPGHNEYPVLGYRRTQTSQYQNSTTIEGNRVKTGKIQSNNFSTTAGSEFDLDNATFTLGGSSNPLLNFDGSNLTMSGSSVELITPNILLGITTGSDANFISASGGNVEISSSNFHLLGGNITASNVDLTGKITATEGSFTGTVIAGTGEIGGFIIDTSEIKSTNLLLDSTNEKITLGSSNAVILQGGGTDNFITMGSKGSFSDEGSGTAGILIGMHDANPQAEFVKDASNHLIFDDGLTLKTTGTTVLSGSSVEIFTPKFFLGSANKFISGSGTNIEISSSGFHLKPEGDAVFSGSITANNGTIGGFTISNTLSSGDLQLNPQLSSGPSIKIGTKATDSDSNSDEGVFITTNNFVIGPQSDTQGFRATKSGQVTASNALIRGNSKIAGFEIDNISISDTGNNLILSSSGQITASNALLDGGTIGGFKINEEKIFSGDGKTTGVDLDNTLGVIGHGDTTDKQFETHKGQFKFSEDTISSGDGDGAITYGPENQIQSVDTGPGEEAEQQGGTN